MCHAPRRRRAFTLVEFVAVLALMAALSGVAAVSLAAFARAHATGDAVDRLRAADAAARHRAETSGRSITLRIDMAAGRLALRDGRDVTTLATLPGGVSIGETATPAGREAYGRVDLPFAGGTGFSPTYALRLDGGGDRRWLVVAGLTGQTKEVADEHIEATLALGGPDAH